MQITQSPRLKSQIETHAAADLIVDPRVQRRLSISRVKNIAKNMNLDGIGTVHVSRRANGDLVIIDGQHRVHALIDLDLGGCDVTCSVYQDLTLAQEASQFRILNRTRQPGAYDDFDKGVVAGDPECVGIATVARSLGLSISDQRSDGQLRCVQTLRRIYRGPETNGSVAHPETLRQVLTIALGAWGNTAVALDGLVLGGIAEVIEAYGDEIDEAALIRKLAKLPGGPARLLGRARALREMRPGSVAHCVAIIIVDVYNQGRRGTALQSL